MKHFWSFAIVAISISLIPFFLSSCAINPAPKAELDTAGTSITEARQSIASARDEKASEFAPNEFKEAEELLQKADETFAKRGIEEAINFAFLTDATAKIALAKTREAKAKYRIERAKDNKMEVYWEAKSNEVAIAKARQSIAEKVAFEAQQNSEISSEVAEIRVQRATTEQVIAKAEVEIKLAFILNAPKYAEQKYNNADASLKGAKLALVSDDYDKAIASAEESAKQAIDAQVDAKSNADAENAETARKKDKAIIAIVKADLALEEAHNSMADQYAKEIYDQAERAIKESKKSFDSTDYDKATTLADQGKLSASNAVAVVKTKVKEEKQNEQTEEIKANALDSVAKAEKSLVQAFNAGANESASDLYKQAQDSLEKAKQAITDSGYEKAITLAQDGFFNANLAIAKAEISAVEKKKGDEILKNVFEDAQKNPGLNAKQTEKGVIISISLDIFTKTGDVKPDIQPILKTIADLIKKYPANRVIIEGHTDNTGTEKANIKLSSDRASDVLIYMSGVEGVSIDKLSSVGYGSLKPVASNNDEAGRKQNRRIDFVMLVR